MLNNNQNPLNQSLLSVPANKKEVITFSTFISGSIAFFGVWALSLINASQLNKLIVDWKGDENTETLWKLENGFGQSIVYYIVMGMLVPFLAGGWTGFRSNVEENKKILNLGALKKFPAVFKEHPAAATIIVFTAATELLVLMGCIKDFFPKRHQSASISLTYIFSIIGAFQYVLLEGKELIKRMSKGNKEEDVWYKKILLQQKNERHRILIQYVIDFISYGISGLVTVGYFALALVESTKIITSIARQCTTGGEREAADWGVIIAVPLTCMYISMYCSLYAYRSQKALRNIVAMIASKIFSLPVVEGSFWEPHLKEFWDKYKETLLIKGKTRKKTRLFFYSILCVINAVGEGVVLTVSIQGLLGNLGLAIFLLFCGFIQNFLVEGVETLKIELEIEEKEDQSVGDSIYSPDKFFVDAIQVAVLVAIRLVIESYVLPEDMKLEDETEHSTITAMAYWLSAMASLLSTYIFSEIPRYRNLINASEAERNKTKNFVTSIIRLVAQNLVQLCLPVFIGLGFEKLFFSYFKSDIDDSWTALNDAQWVAAISTGFATVVLRKMVDYLFEQYHKQPENIGWSARLWGCTKSVARSMSACGEEDNQSQRDSSNELKSYAKAEVMSLTNHYNNKSDKFRILYQECSKNLIDDMSKFLENNIIIVLHDLEIRNNSESFGLIWIDKAKKEIHYLKPTLETEDQTYLKQVTTQRPFDSYSKESYPGFIARHETGPYVVEMIRSIVENGKLPEYMNLVNLSAARQRHQKVLSNREEKKNEDMPDRQFSLSLP